MPLRFALAPLVIPQIDETCPAYQLGWEGVTFQEMLFKIRIRAAWLIQIDMSDTSLMKVCLLARSRWSCVIVGCQVEKTE